jgi:hypothetical protein
MNVTSRASAASRRTSARRGRNAAKVLETAAGRSAISLAITVVTAPPLMRPRAAVVTQEGSHECIRG